ncbi:MAG: IS3 family transposase [Bacteroidota bacterium]
MSYNSTSRKQMIESGSDLLSVRQQCNLLEVPRSMIYYQASGESSLNLELMRLIDEIHLLDPSFGSPRMTQILLRLGYQVNIKRIARLMRKMGIRARYPAPKTSQKGSEHQVFPYLLKGLDIIRSDQVWATDITYIPVEGGFFYLVVIMDLHSRYILAWELSNSLEIQFCLDALDSALSRSTPEIFNSDQGAQFTSSKFVDKLLDKDVQVSHDGKGRFLDNIFVERLWRSLKYEEVYAFCYQSGTEAYKRIENWIFRYNEIRPHQSLNYATPKETYFGLPQQKLTLSRLRNSFF